MANEAPEKKGTRMQRLLRDQRVVVAISFFLAVIVWLVLAVINGDEQEITISNVPVSYDLTDTVAEELGLQPFWSGPLTNPNEMSVTVVVRCRRYENITADSLKAELSVGNVYTAGEHTVPIRVSAKRTTDEDRFTIVSASPASIPLYFDHEKSLEFELTATDIADIQVEEGYHAQDILLSQKSVSVSGPAKLVDAIVSVRAEINADEVYRETAVFEGVAIIPMDKYGDSSPYLKVEGGSPQVNATLRVWKKAAVLPSVDFQNVPGAYLSRPLKVTIKPASVRAALPEDSIAADQRYSVGVINFRRLSPSNNRFMFKAEELKEIQFFDGTESFTAEVDMNGYAAVKLNLSAAQVSLAANDAFTARFFGDVGTVTVVGPADVVESLKAEALAGEAELPEDAKAGSANLPVAVKIKNHEDCWAFGEYTVRATLTEKPAAE